MGVLQFRDELYHTLHSWGCRIEELHPLSQHSLPSLLFCSLMKPLQGTPDAETQWVKCHRSIVLD